MRSPVTPAPVPGPSGTAIAVDLGATNLRVALVTSTGTIEQVRVSRLPKDLPDAQVITDQIVREIRALAPGKELSKAAGIGIGAAGPVDSTRTAIVHPPNIPLDKIPLAGPLSEEFGLPVRLANDCCTGLLGEAYYGEGLRSDNFVYVTLSTGIGAGILSKGHLVLGRDGNAGEIGHVFVDEKYDLVCGCGGRGHWEGYASGRFLPRFYRAWQERNGIDPGRTPVNAAEDIFAAIRKEKDPGAHPFVSELGRINARGVSDIIVAYDPDTIVFDGSVALKNPDLVLGPILRFMDRYLPEPRIVTSPLNGRAPLLGAAIIARGYETRFGSVEY
ncbi:MAG: ROK family protein [Methanoregula sp.]|nr:ROK family protein [Methanoregula sp.]